ncbi:DUF3039 domain-containing protein [Kribbella antibiotica]|uniref:DUF3039 domain-containing protein n=1 Tax=Kribbella antibiotica TaxID=190195 RepID=A0A4R4ZNW0_9ACTN|nr:DUF3039 domain-containing protein [Kribbella antibiotica]
MPGDCARPNSPRSSRRTKLVDSELGSSSHYVHRRGLASCTIEGRSARSMCGVYFVPMQVHESLPPCETCATRFAGLAEQQKPRH